MGAVPQLNPVAPAAEPQAQPLQAQPPQVQPPQAQPPQAPPPKAQSQQEQPQPQAVEKTPFFGAPTAKVGTGALAAAIITLLVGLLKGHAKWVEDASVVAAMTSICTFVVQYLVPERK